MNWARSVSLSSRWVVAPCATALWEAAAFPAAILGPVDAGRGDGVAALVGLPGEMDLPGLRMGVIFPAMMQFCMLGQLFTLSECVSLTFNGCFCETNCLRGVGLGDAALNPGTVKSRYGALADINCNLRDRRNSSCESQNSALL